MNNGSGIVAVMVAVLLEDGQQVWIAGRCSPFLSECEIGFERDIEPLWDHPYGPPTRHFLRDRVFNVKGRFHGFEGQTQWKDGPPDPDALHKTAVIPEPPKQLMPPEE